MSSFTIGTEVGCLAPDFKLQNEKKEWVTLSEVSKDQAVLLAFYPRDFSPVCTKQLCNYQESYDRFVDYGIKLLAISSDSPEKHAQFKLKYQFSYELLSDPKGKVTKAFGVTSFLLFGGASRAIFIIAKGGKVLYRYVETTPITHRKPGELLAVLDDLKSKGQI